MHRRLPRESEANAATGFMQARAVWNYHHPADDVSNSDAEELTGKL
jgi:hypothetical protein